MSLRDDGNDNPSVSFADSSLYTREPFGVLSSKKPPLCKGRWVSEANPEGVACFSEK